jgi:4'-phosphopantetheinyl transferase
MVGRGRPSHAADRSPTGRAALGLDHGAVHVWLGDVRELGAAIAPIGWLSDDEWRRAARFRHDVHRTRFVVRRAVVRRILASYVGGDGSKLIIQPDHFGKPHLRPEVLHFNTSHSRDLVAIAIAAAPVGVDVERIDEQFDVDLVVDQLSAAERAVVLAHDGRRRSQTFTRCWTAKEACLKACGVGLSGDLRSFDVSSALEAGSCVRVDGVAGVARPLTLSCHMGEGAFALAVASDEPCRRVIRQATAVLTRNRSLAATRQAG